MWGWVGANGVRSLTPLFGTSGPLPEKLETKLRDAVQPPTGEVVPCPFIVRCLMSHFSRERLIVSLCSLLPSQPLHATYGQTHCCRSPKAPQGAPPQ